MSDSSTPQDSAAMSPASAGSPIGRLLFRISLLLGCTPGELQGKLTASDLARLTEYMNAAR